MATQQLQEWQHSLDSVQISSRYGANKTSYDEFLVDKEVDHADDETSYED